MAPKGPTRLPLRWEFKPDKAPTGLIIWTWIAYSQTGVMVMTSERAFDTLTECAEDAKRHGYQPP